MFDKLKNMASKASDALASTTVMVGDLNGDGKIDEEDGRIAAAWAKKTATAVGDEAARLGKEAVRSDMAKDAAAGAAIGAVVAVPVPVIGPIAGAAIGAGLGVYKNFLKKGQNPSQNSDGKGAIDIHSELLKLNDLREKGILTDAEFEDQKTKVLSRRES